ncbi:MAG: CRISPR-associated helicase Cas3' [Rhodospirillales bacterium]|nr:MAG: CRISPR-associated helicase Cas3' [Rhodospirillales bacterium]
MDSPTAAEDSHLLLQFWGKARPAPASRHPVHPFVYHSLDVAAVGKVMLERQLGVAAQCAARLGMTIDRTKALLVFLLALHDVGKISSPFQQQAPEHWPTAALGPASPTPRLRHDALGRFRLLELAAGDGVRALAGLRPSRRRLLVDAVVGHHGRPSEELDALQGIDRPCMPYVRRFLHLMEALFTPAAPEGVSLSDVAVLSWRLAGLTVLCDWIGSNESWFPYEPPDHDPEVYFERLALPRAARAVTAAGLLPARTSAASSFATLIGTSHTPSPVQNWSERAPLPEGPVLILIEDMTGSGKTEAALLLAKRLMDRGSVQGIFLALPTMATANGMYARLAVSYRRLFAAGETPSLVLAHSARRLHRRFTASIGPCRIDVLDSGGSRIQAAPITPSLAADSEEDADRLGDDAGAACAAWVADDRRRTFLADVGVGTIDQAFLSVLPSKYQSLRLFGLADRVLVVDEAHAFDPYMGEELLALLRFQAALGGSAVILSATLPMTRRGAIVQAFLQGLGADPATVENTGYPLTTLVAGCGITEEEHATRADLPRNLGVARLADEDAAYAYVEAARAAGAGVAWIRNTVDDVFEAAAKLEARGHEVTVFHARMAMGDRLVLEEEVVARFGRDGPPETRPGILVATQVIEQSLDLDFDAMVSDLAPIDLLLQRAGRLWRHPGRLRPVAGPELAVLSPEPILDAGGRWYEAVFPRAAWVYKDHALLWLTACTLFGRAAWRIPDDVRQLIETVDVGLVERAFPSGLERRANDAEGDAGASRGHARANLLKVDEGYAKGGAPWDTDIRTPTRLGEDTSTLRLARVEQENLVPWFADEDPRRAWALSEVSVRASRAAREVIPEHLCAAAGRVRAGWSRYDQHKLLVVLARNAQGGWVGEIEGADQAIRPFEYTNERGMAWWRSRD